MPATVTCSGSRSGSVAHPARNEQGHRERERDDRTCSPSPDDPPPTWRCLEPAAADHCQGSGQFAGTGIFFLQKPAVVIDGSNRVLKMFSDASTRVFSSPVRFAMSRVGVVAGIEERKLANCVRND